MTRLLTIAAVLASLMVSGTVAKADAQSCISKMVVNAQDTHSDQVKAAPKVYAKIKNDLNGVVASINKDDRNRKIQTLLDATSVATGAVLNQTANKDINDTVAAIYRKTINTIAFIEKNAKDPNSPNIAMQKKDQVTAAVDQVISAYLSCN